MSIAFVSAGSAAGSTVTSTTVAVTVPAGAVGDLLLVAASVAMTASASTPVVTGSTVNLTLLWSATTQLCSTCVYYRFVQSGDPSSYTFTATVGAPLSAVAVRYSGVDSTTPFRNFNGFAPMDHKSGTSTSGTLAALDNVQPNDMVVAFAAEGKSTKSATITALSTPASWTQRVTKTGPVSGTTAFPVCLASYDRLGATDTPTITGDTGFFDVLSVALIPADNPVPDAVGGTITFRNAATAVTTVTGATTLTVNKPTGVVDGDLMILTANQTAGTAKFAPPAGWKSIETARGGFSFGAAGTTDIDTQVWYKTASSEASSYAVGCTTSSGSTSEMALTIVAYTGLRSPYPIKLHASTWQSTAAVSTSIVPYVMPEVSADNLLVVIYSFGGDATGTMTVTPPGTFTSRSSVVSAVATDFNAAIMVVDKLGGGSQPTASASRVGCWTVHSLTLVGASVATASRFMPLFM